MLEALESHLARWTGKDGWPLIATRTESRKALGRRNIPATASEQFTFLSYTVKGKTYTAAIRNTQGQGSGLSRKAEAVSLQYNPRIPEMYYYAPARKLASRFLILCVVLTAAVLIAFAVHSAG
jgi:hypothetical protein